MSSELVTPKFQIPSTGMPRRSFRTSASSTAASRIPVIMESLKFEKDLRAAEGSLYEFLKQCWHIVEPGVEFSEGWHIHTICDHLEAVSDRRIKNLIINIPPRHAIRLGTPVPTTRGMVRIEDLTTGDYVFDPDGLPTRVLGKSEVFHNREMYRVTTDDGCHVDVDAEHLWTVRLDRKYGQENTYTTEQLFHRQNGSFLRKLRGGGVELNHARRTNEVRNAKLPSCKGVRGEHVELPLDPYILGVWLGDGTAKTSHITSPDWDAPHIMGEIERRGWTVHKTGTKMLYLVRGLQTKLREMGVLGNKHIPAIYMTASYEQRRDLVRGLMDTDGTAHKGDGQCVFSQKIKSISDDLATLLRSLGVKAFVSKRKATLYGKDCGDSHTVSFYSDEMFSLPRKAALSRASLRTPDRYVSFSKTSEVADCQCITVNRDDGLFQVGEGYILTHNSKSTICSVVWPVWAWLKNPSEKFLTASYSSSLSIRDAVKSRRLLESPWFKERWSGVQLNRDQNTKQRYENDDTGYRIAVSVGSSTTGEGGSVLLIDDAHGAQDAQSDTMRNSTLDWLDMVWSSRKNDPKTSCSVVIMQRLHSDDTTGHLLKQGNYEHLCLPAEYDGVRRKTSLGEYDPRTERGELLWPNRFGKVELETLKKALGAYGASGQLQQQPSPEGGGILKIAHVQLWPANKVLPDIQYIVQSYDTAFTERTTGDPTGCITFGVFNYKDKQNVLILDAWTEHLAYPDLKERVMDDWKARYGGQKDHPTDKGRRPDVILVEAKASGQSLLQDLRQSNIPAAAYNPGRADKVQRAHLMAPILESDCIWVIESSKNAREPVTWVKPVLENWEKFPVVAHDELTDAASQCIIFLKDNNWLDVTVHEDEESERHADDRRRVANPYGA